MNCVPKDDFNGGHADPNLTYAKELVALMGLDRKGMKVETGDRKIPSFGCAADGDGVGVMNDTASTMSGLTQSSEIDDSQKSNAKSDKDKNFTSIGGLRVVDRSPASYTAAETRHLVDCLVHALLQPTSSAGAQQ